MAGRPQKFTVDYFPHDSHAGHGRTLTILFNHFGHEGISAWWLLLEAISSTNNHIIDTRNSEDLEYLAAKLHFTPDKLKEILAKLSDLGAIDKELYSKGFVWSQNLVERLTPVYKARGQPLPEKGDISLIRNCIVCGRNIADRRQGTKYCSKKCRQKEGQSTDNRQQSTDNSQLSVDFKKVFFTDKSISSTDKSISSEENQFLGKEITPTKGTKGTKGTKIKSSNTKKSFSEFKNVFLSLKEYQRLIDLFSESGTKSRIETLSLYKESTGKRYKSDYATILNWEHKGAKDGTGTYKQDTTYPYSTDKLRESLRGRS